MSRTSMHLLTFACVAVAVACGFYVVRTLSPRDAVAVAHAAPPSDAAPRPAAEPRPLTPPPTSAGAIPAQDAAAAALKRRASLLLVGGWRIDPEASRDANGELSRTEAERLRREITGMEGAVAEYREDGTILFERVDNGAVISSATWAVSGMADRDVVLTFVHEDGTRVHQRVAVPSYDHAATQVDEFVFVWRRHVVVPRPARARPAPSRPLPPPAAHPSMPRADSSNAGAPAVAARQSYAWEGKAAEQRWESFQKKSAEQVRGGACDQAQRCVAQCPAGDAACPVRCNEAFGCGAQSPLYAH